MFYGCVGAKWVKQNLQSLSYGCYNVGNYDMSKVGWGILLGDSHSMTSGREACLI